MSQDVHSQEQQLYNHSRGGRMLYAGCARDAKDTQRSEALSSQETIYRIRMALDLEGMMHEGNAPEG